MEWKGGNSAVVTTAETVSSSLKKVQRAVSAEEDKALRMRYGARVEVGEPLPRAAGGDQDLEDELLLIEMRLLKAWKMKQAGAPQLHQARPQTSPAKDKIVRALRKKKS